MADDLGAILRAAQHQGFTVRQTRRGHWMVRNPQGRVVTVFSGSASDRRALRNGLAQLRRAGFVWPPPSKR